MNMTIVFLLPANHVAAPWLSRSLTSGRARHVARSRSSGSSSRAAAVGDPTMPSQARSVSASTASRREMSAPPIHHAAVFCTMPTIARPQIAAGAGSRPRSPSPCANVSATRWAICSVNAIVARLPPLESLSTMKRYSSGSFSTYSKTASIAVRIECGGRSALSLGDLVVEDRTEVHPVPHP